MDQMPAERANRPSRDPESALLSNFCSVGTMLLKYPSRRKLAEFVPDHILGHKNRNERLAIVNHERVPYEVGSYH